MLFWRFNQNYICAFGQLCKVNTIKMKYYKCPNDIKTNGRNENIQFFKTGKIY